MPGVRVLYRWTRRRPRDRWLDLNALFRVVFPRNEINRIRYFTAIVEARPPDLRQPVLAGPERCPRRHPQAPLVVVPSLNR
jgi:hypothetical protein